jgi:hypothetical protein
VPLLLDGDTPAVIRGTVAVVPPPSAATWWLIGLAGAAAVALAALRSAGSRWVLGGAALACGAVAIWLTVSAAVAATTPGAAGELLTQLVSRSWPLLTGLATVAAGLVTLLRRAGAARPDFALAVAGGCVALMAGIANGAVFGHGVLAGPGWSRPAVAAIVALGAGLAVGGAVRWYRRPPSEQSS